MVQKQTKETHGSSQNDKECCTCATWASVLSCGFCFVRKRNSWKRRTIFQKIDQLDRRRIENEVNNSRQPRSSLCPRLDLSGFYDTVFQKINKQESFNNIIADKTSRLFFQIKQNVAQIGDGEKKKRGTSFPALFWPGHRKEQIIHSDTPGHCEEVVSVEVQMPQQTGGGGLKKRERERWGGKKVACEWLLKSPPPLITLCTAAAHRAA